ncbi:Cytosolic carboxypeptidase 1 [Chytriomyces hyalinus]|nr:Cytosolic carboxypeptidase 1 [Chytriomyces hyalinus]
MAPIVKTGTTASAVPTPRVKKATTKTVRNSKDSSQSGSTSNAKSGAAKVKRLRAPLPLSLNAGRPTELEEAMASVKLGKSSKVLPNILSRGRETLSTGLQYSNISPPSSFLAAKAFDQLAGLLSDVAVQCFKTEEPTLDDSTPDATSNLILISTVKSFSVPSSRRCSSQSLQPATSSPSKPNQTNRTASAASTKPSSASLEELANNPKQIPPLPRHISDPMLYIKTHSNVLNAPASDRELRRRVVKQCLEIKRILDKECGGSAGGSAPSTNQSMFVGGGGAAGAVVLGPSLSTDSPLQKVFYSKSCVSSGVSVLLKCIRIIHDVDISIIVTNLLLRTITSTTSFKHTTTSGSNSTSFNGIGGISGISISSGDALSSSGATSNVSFLVRKNATPSLISCFAGIVQSYSYIPGYGPVNEERPGKSQTTGLPSGVASLASRTDEAVLNLFHILVKIGKHDLKLPMIARLHGCVEMATEVVKRWQERKEVVSCILGFQLLRQLAFKNEQNVTIMHKRGILECIAAFLKSISLGPTMKDAKEFQAADIAIDLVTLFAKNESCISDVIRLFKIPYFLLLFNSLTGYDALRKSILKLLRAIVDTGPGRKEFNATDGMEILTSYLEDIMQQNDISVSFTSNTTNTIPSLLIAVLRSAVSETDLPYADNIQHRQFTLPTPTPPIDTASDPATPTSNQEQQIDHSNDTSPLATPQQPRRKRVPKLVKQNSGSQTFLETPFTTEEETILSNLCPELLQPCTVEDIPTRILKSVYPTNFDIPSVPIVLNRDPADYCPTLKLPIPVPATPTARITTYTSPTPKEVEPQCKKSNTLLRKTVYEQTSRILRPGLFSSVVVYDVMEEAVRSDAVFRYPDVLKFESRFESGNLQLAVKVQETEYDLILQSDIGAKPGRHNQWFYFSVSNLNASLTYKFNIINMSKGSSQFGDGMQPVFYSKREKMWRRGGENICFYKNHYRKPDGTKPEDSKPNASPSTYSTLTFHLRHPHGPADTLFIAYHYPYTVSDLTMYLDTLQIGHTETPVSMQPCEEFNARCRRQALCLSVGGNQVELLTITAFDEASLVEVPISERVYIFLTARVHPGESNSSYIMHGVIQYLLRTQDDTALTLLKKCIFKIVPMLNPDGVISGNHRCGLAGTDLNRAWQNPCRASTPSIYWTKALWRYLVEVKAKRPLICCDFHGHSRKKNVFLFGCENGVGVNEGIEKIFPSLMATLSPVFDANSCKYTVEKSKESTARIVMWREMGVVSSYTLESSYCGADVGERKGLQIQIPDLERVGVDFCCAIWASLAIFDGRVPVAAVTAKKGKEAVNQGPSNNNSVLSVTPLIATCVGADSDSSCDDK